jgi:hypothetical protein
MKPTYEELEQRVRELEQWMSTVKERAIKELDDLKTQLSIVSSHVELLKRRIFELKAFLKIEAEYNAKNSEGGGDEKADK